MNDRYLMAFISSTKRDLDAQRMDVFRTLVNSRCIPVSMESFPPGNPTMEFIRERMRECDLVVLILNNYYGSRENPEHPDSPSYTQLEYQYAVERKIPILALVRANPENHPDQSAADWDSFQAFRRQVMGVGHTVGLWQPDARLHDQLTYHLQIGLADVRQRLAGNPAAGLRRADEVPPQLIPLVEGCRQLGIDHILSDGNQRQDQLDRRLAAAQAIKIFATTAEPLIRAKGGMLTAALANGARLQILVADQNGLFIRDVEEVETLRDGLTREMASELVRIRGYLGGYLTSARDRASRAGRSPGTVAIGAFTTQFRMTQILCDEDWGRVTLTLPPHRATSTASFELGLGATLDPLLRQFHEHFDYNWRIAERHGRVTDL